MSQTNICFLGWPMFKIILRKKNGQKIGINILFFDNSTQYTVYGRSCFFGVKNKIRIFIIKSSWQPKRSSLFSSKIVADDDIPKNMNTKRFKKGREVNKKKKKSIRPLRIPLIKVSFSNYVSFSSNALPISSIF